MKIHLSILLMFASFLLGCSTTQESTSRSPDMARGGMERLLVRSASLSIDVDDIEAASKNVADDIANIEGYIDRTYRRDDKSISMDLRVPESGLDAFVNRASQYGVVKSRSLSAVDVTDEIIDVEARLKNLYVLRDRFRALLDKAVKVSEILEIERELSRIQSDIDSMEGRRSKIKSQVKYSEVHLFIEQKTIYGPIGYIGYGLYWLVTKLFIIK